MESSIRINKYVRDKGFASRREADQLIEAGLVLVNGEKAKNGMLVNDTDRIEIKAKRRKHVYLAYNKPRGISTQSILNNERKLDKWSKEGIYHVGRLDKESQGLIIFTNDGQFARRLLSKETPYEKEYIVTTRENLRTGIPRIFRSGMDIKNFGKLLPAQARIVDKTTLKVILREGKKHQIRVMLNELNCTITSLKRIRIGKIKLAGLKPGEIRDIKPF